MSHSPQFDLSALQNIKVGPSQQNLREHYQQYIHLQEISATLSWDSETYMPELARENKAEQQALLAKLAHQKMTEESLGKLLTDSINALNDSDSSSEKKILMRELAVLQRDRNRATCLPSELVAKFSRITQIANGVWGQARSQKKFSLFQAHLEEVVHCVREMAECYGYEQEPYDALLEEYEPGMTAQKLEIIFADLKKQIVPLVKRGKTYANPFNEAVPFDLQKKFNLMLPEYLGLQKNTYRLDESAHPFSTSLGKKDKRITAHYTTHDPFSGIYSVLHETGHALYEAGLSEISTFATPLAVAASYGVHESQSRLWENLIGRSSAFLTYWHPIMCDQLGISTQKLKLTDLIQYANSVQPSKIRVEADPVTYNLHVIIRFEIERLLISGKIQVSDLPEIWNQKMAEYLGQKIENDAEGVLQDVHWSWGAFGYFPSYALGNIYAAQLYAAFTQQHPHFEKNLAQQGDTAPLLAWLRKNVHGLGRYYLPEELIIQASQKPISAQYLIQALSKQLDAFGQV